ncbi:FMN-binding negative transcriptional regulator [Thermasporomyces composti]|uniref:PaiB family negative transcriptional regulator n=1 Tax=Thermasporomyces composti TaxID=696763 RepID=A0A3D9V3Z8_THECX|nr:FMN-binding negative transcriptional regulator [Thermasporomyces composti]REF34930.1 PaiB family negative transcriptional regulator [Thermasporomyces composti]
MLIHPWDQAADEEWRSWLAEHDFGQLVASGRDRDVPVVVPTHFVFDGIATAWLHLARPNPVWPLLEANPRCVLSVVDDYVYATAAWQAEPGSPPELGVPTSYYATVQLICDVRIIDDPEEKAALLNRQLAHFEPNSGRVPVSTTGPDRRLLPGLRGAELTVTDVRAKFKYAGTKEPAHRRQIAARLRARGGRFDAAACAHILRRLEAAEPAAAAGRPR